ncbi:MAG: DUF1015 domain-containing protein [Clostridia bacterium]|nr:DUF1015 domain-containing protein [Clostridia bacterium]
MKNCGFIPTDILLPANADMTKWSCVACDQYTSEPEYWKAVEKTVGDSVSTLSLMLPEIYLDDIENRSVKITETMREYLDSGVFREIEDSFVYVERTLADGRVRRGLVGAIDLEIYDFSKDTKSLCRPTEATVTSRLPARVRVRAKAAVEMPHIMMLLNDPERTVIEPYSEKTAALEKLYDFELMQNSGHIRGYRVHGDDSVFALSALEKLYVNSKEENPMLYAMGDGNHSLAAAKQYYEMLKDKLGEKAKNHPARYALLELVNLHDASLDFEPIHRVLFDVDTEKFMHEFADCCGLTPGAHDGQVFTVIIGDCEQKYTFTDPRGAVTVGNIQDFIDEYTKINGGRTDYIHGEDVVRALASQPRRIGFVVDGISKNSFFDVIKKDGILPRKTFSMGHAADKRFYLECRRIVSD